MEKQTRDIRKKMQNKSESRRVGKNGKGNIEGLCLERVPKERNPMTTKEEVGTDRQQTK